MERGGQGLLFQGPHTSNLPYANPGLPPRKTIGHWRRRYHPCVDVDTVGKPETDKVPSFPLTALWLDGLQVVICEELLSVGEARLAVGLEPLPQASLGHFEMCRMWRDVLTGGINEYGRV